MEQLTLADLDIRRPPAYTRQRRYRADDRAPLDDKSFACSIRSVQRAAYSVVRNAVRDGLQYTALPDLPLTGSHSTVSQTNQKKEGALARPFLVYPKKSGRIRSG